ncbi:hypothetical protein [Croceicoccus sp. Ery15]|uniref:hypothetical protein n=1 Tax=Croceicoccus sp. Ery15 TaxID=1703338 RepID=UPI001E3EC86D|nr:hypothetical protein [Croceicoccus sp. Ery15]
MTLSDKIAAITALIGGVCMAFGWLSTTEAATLSHAIGEIAVALAALWKLFQQKVAKDEIAGELESTQASLSAMIERRPL